MYVLGSGERLTRKALILGAANKDGGAHVDKRLSDEYEGLSRDGAVGQFIYSTDGKSGEIPSYEAHFVGIRQIAHELLNSTELLELAKAGQ